MRVLYIGKSDSLAAEIVNCFRKEDNDVYIMSESEFKQGIKPELKFKSYLVTGSYSDTEKFFVNIKPELVIFAGELYQKEEWRPEEQTNLFLQQLLNALNFSVSAGTDKFIFLSSSHVLSGGAERKDEDVPADPSDYKGIMYAQAEEMVRLRTQRSDMEGIILRTDLILGCNAWEDCGNLTQRIVKSFERTGAYTADKHRIYTPVYTKDIANAILRLGGVTVSGCYHAAGNEEITQAGLAKLINQRLGNKYRVEEKDRKRVSYPLSALRIKKELEWLPFYSIEDALDNMELCLHTGEKKKKRRKKNNSFLSEAVRVIENFIIFFLFAFVTIWMSDNPAMGNIDLMTVYILLAALLFGMKQSVPSILYTCIFCILFAYEEQNSLSAILTNVATLLQFSFYIFIGVAAGYTVDHYKLKIKDKETEYRFLEKEYEAINEINSDNLMIKQEYHKRLLNYKNSLPKLYSVISRLTVLEPERIFSETVQAVKDIMEVETAAVYLAKPGSSYMRLIVSSDERAVFGGKSWNLDEYPAIREAFLKDEVYIGSVRSDSEPALAAPIFYQGVLTAALVIKEVPFNILNLNYTNLFRTLTVMISSSVVKAKDYENMVRRELYLPETEIFYPSEFKRMLDIAESKKQQGIADFCILRLEAEGTASEIYFKLANLFRNTDFFGIDDRKRLYVLLGNTSEKEVPFVEERIRKNKAEAWAVDAQELEALEFSGLKGKPDSGYEEEEV